jgi:sugar phosphate isomerase/epimerase
VSGKDGTLGRDLPTDKPGSKSRVAAEAHDLPLGSAVYTYLWECPLEAAIERCARLGFATLEVPTTPPFLWPAHFGPFERRQLRRRMRDAGVRLFSLNPTFLDLNLISLNPAIREASLAEAKETVRLAADLGAELVVLAPGRRHPLIPSPLDDAEEVAVEQIGECVELATQVGVTIGVENVPGLFVATGSQVARLVERVDSLRCRAVFDVANALMVEDPAAGLTAVAQHLALVHYSDARRDAWAHLPVGMGEVDFTAATRTLREVGFEGPVILEVTYPEDPDGGLSSSIEELSRLGFSSQAAGT